MSLLVFLPVQFLQEVWSNNSFHLPVGQSSHVLSELRKVPGGQTIRDRLNIKHYIIYKTKCNPAEFFCVFCYDFILFLLLPKISRLVWWFTGVQYLAREPCTKIPPQKGNKTHPSNIYDKRTERYVSTDTSAPVPEVDVIKIDLGSNTLYSCYHPTDKALHCQNPTSQELSSQVHSPCKQGTHDMNQRHYSHNPTSICHAHCSISSQGCKKHNQGSTQWRNTEVLSPQLQTYIDLIQKIIELINRIINRKPIIKMDDEMNKNLSWQTWKTSCSRNFASTSHTNSASMQSRHQWSKLNPGMQRDHTGWPIGTCIPSRSQWNVPKVWKAIPR